MLDDAAAIIAGDIESVYQQQRAQAAAERNN
jgi:diphthamide synthase (EF-2-diphthine--ammonia ligase)